MIRISTLQGIYLQGKFTGMYTSIKRNVSSNAWVIHVWLVPGHPEQACLAQAPDRNLGQSWQLGVVPVVRYSELLGNTPGQ